MDTRKNLFAALTLTLSLATAVAAQEATPSSRSPNDAVKDQAGELIVLQLRRDFRIPQVKGTATEGLSQRDHALFAAAFTELVEEGGVRPQQVAGYPDQMHDRFQAPGSGTAYGLVGSVHLNVLSKDDGRTIAGGLTHVDTIHVYLYAKGVEIPRQGVLGPYYNTEFGRDEDSAPIAAAWVADAHSADVLRYIKGLKNGSLMLTPVTSPSTWAALQLEASPVDPAPQEVAVGPLGIPLG